MRSPHQRFALGLVTIWVLLVTEFQQAFGISMYHVTDRIIAAAIRLHLKGSITKDYKEPTCGQRLL